LWTDLLVCVTVTMVVTTASMVYTGVEVVAGAYETDDGALDEDTTGAAAEELEAWPAQRVRRVSAVSSQESEFSSSFQTV
jgi:hypothetical protein